MIKINFDEMKKQAIAYDGDLKIGECNYEVVDNKWNIIHTSVSESHQGQGIARKLVECVVENANKRNIKVIADCGYAKNVIEKIVQKRTSPMDERSREK